MTETTDCPFCDLPPDRVLRSGPHASALPDQYPITEGHTLVVPTRHVASLYDLPPEEQAALWELAAEVRAALEASHDPDGFNIGVNDGEAAGQTVTHAHIHVIPRYGGDVADPRGGIRWVVPEKAAYWEVE